MTVGGREHLPLHHWIKVTSNSTTCLFHISGTVWVKLHIRSYWMRQINIYDNLEDNKSG